MPFSSLYFVVAPSVNRVKVGYTNTLSRRIRELQTYSPIPVYVFGYILHVQEQTAKDMEKSLCRRFQALRVHGEWFDWTREYQEAVADAILDAKGLGIFGCLFPIRRKRGRPVPIPFRMSPKHGQY